MERTPPEHFGSHAPPFPAEIEALVEPLAGHIALALERFAPRLGREAVSVLAMDCHPWHGVLELSVLLASEADEDEGLRSDGEQASWRCFQFTRDAAAQAQWKDVTSIAERFRTHYDGALDRKTAARDAFVCCARALVHPNARRAIESLRRSADFVEWVVDPDDPAARNYCDLASGRAPGRREP